MRLCKMRSCTRSAWIVAAPARKQKASGRPGMTEQVRIVLVERKVIFSKEVCSHEAVCAKRWIQKASDEHEWRFKRLNCQRVLWGPNPLATSLPDLVGLTPGTTMYCGSTTGWKPVPHLAPHHSVAAMAWSINSCQSPHRESSLTIDSSAKTRTALTK